jgi:tetratricopeptide (TPR) repeat protein
VEPAARAALALEPDEPRATLAISTIYELGGRWLDIEVNDQRAMALSSGDVRSEFVRGQRLIALGKLREGLKKVRAGYALAPANTTIILSLGLSYSLVGQNEEAEKLPVWQPHCRAQRTWEPA